MAAGTLNGVITALLISAFVDDGASWRRALTVGGVSGLALAAIVFLAKGGWASWDAPYVLPAGLVVGLILGPIVRRMTQSRV